MNRYQLMLKLKETYEGILQYRDANRFLQRESEIDEAFLELQALSHDPYSDSERDLLKIISELNHAMEELLVDSMNQLQHTRMQTPRASKQYETPGIAESYFYDRKL
ncbi:hypothetical protein JCM10914A_15250 [Paenibacillus sp. JCM 10914]|uniref:hypothetical protein n=1 Tax=Paenibacillus sp. JCM 10914 TaxID=1236974 RepID=UPI00056CBFEE|nr:hypothetical protein [Paenibacillus sp. JCM 10914]